MAFQSTFQRIDNLLDYIESLPIYDIRSSEVSEEEKKPVSDILREPRKIVLDANMSTGYHVGQTVQVPHLHDNGVSIGMVVGVDPVRVRFQIQNEDAPATPTPVSPPPRKQISIPNPERNNKEKARDRRKKLSAIKNASKKVAVEKGPKPKILMLHGYMQNSPEFEGKNRKKLFKYLARNNELVFFNGPHQCKLNCATEKNRTYHDFSDKILNLLMTERLELLKPENALAEWLGLDETLSLLLEFWEAQGPFDAILSFSMSTQFANLLCYLREQNIAPFTKIKCVVLCSAMLQPFPSNHSFGEVSKNYQNIFNLPSLHCWSINDEYVHEMESEGVASMYMNAETLIMEHKNHALPGKAKDRNKVVEFLSKHLSTGKNV